jgi:hypothetical protein
VLGLMNDWVGIWMGSEFSFNGGILRDGKAMSMRHMLVRI